MKKLDVILSVLQKHLHSDEKVLSALLAIDYDTKLLGNILGPESVLVATDRRLLYFIFRNFRFELTEYPYENLQSIETGKGVMGQFISLYVTGTRAILKWVDKSSEGKAPCFVKTVKAQMRRLAIVQKAAEESTEDSEAENDDFYEDTIGLIMSEDFFAVPQSYTVGEALHFLRHHEVGAQTKYYLYAVDQDQVLTGVVSLRNLISEEDHQKIKAIMTPNVVSVRTTDDQQEVAWVMQDKGFVSVPVVDENGKLVGIVHAESALDIMEEETTEDFHKIASIGQIKESIKEASIFLLFKKRIGWLLALVFINIFSGAGIEYFEDTIHSVVSLVFFLPLLIACSGNAGSQSATLMVRALATDEVTAKDWATLFIKELKVALLLGVSMGGTASILGLIWGGSNVAPVVALTMIIVVVAGSMIGMLLPYAFNRLNIDPATASAPLVTSLADISGVLIYFSIANWYLGL